MSRIRTVVLRMFFGVVLCLIPLSAQQVDAVVNLGDWSSRLTFHSLAAVFGTGLALEECAALKTPLPNKLCGVSVTVVDASGVEALAPLFFVSPNQINLQIPASQFFTGKDPIREQSLPVTVRFRVNPSGASRQVTLEVFAEPAILEYQSPEGIQEPVVLHANGTLVTEANPAEWGESLIMYGIGFGIYTRDNILALEQGRWASSFPLDGQAAPGDQLIEFPPGVILQVSGRVGSQPVGELYAIPDFLGLTPGFVGLSQINFQMSSILAKSAEPEIMIESFVDGKRSKAYRIPMSEAAQASWAGPFNGAGRCL